MTTRLGSEVARWLGKGGTDQDHVFGLRKTVELIEFLDQLDLLVVGRPLERRVLLHVDLLYPEGVPPLIAGHRREGSGKAAAVHGLGEEWVLFG